MSTPGPSESSRSLNSQQVLEEDEYTAALSHIIARDFFPSLVHLDATNEYLDAVTSRDPHLINASVRRLQEVNSTPATYRGRPWQTPSATPYGAGASETPLHTPRGEPVTKRPRYNTSMSLDNFQARYTSEDNASFTQIMDEENRKRKERWGWAWEAQKRVEDQRDRMIEARERMMIEPSQAPGVREKFVIEAPNVAGLITQSGESSKEPEGKSQDTKDNDKGKEVAILSEAAEEGEPMDVMAPRKDTRPAGVDGWNFKARNSLMFSPDADMSPYHPRTSKAKASDDLGIITHVNTRLTEQDEGDSQSRAASAPPSPTRSRIDAAITGTPYRPRSPINEFSLVPSLPSPTAAELGPSAVNQLMTWGTLNATPRILSKSDDPAEALPLPSTPFHIAAPSSREALSHRLSSHASKSLRAKAILLGGPTPIIGRTPARGSSSKSGSMGPPSWTPRRADAPGNLTPAAKRLLDRTTMGTAAARRAEAMGRMSGWETRQTGERDLNRVRWTPTPTTRGG
ncbi:nuclear protein DGCR14 [Suillus plorans]|uniref:Nuclear protein DGCR14 n=1 Tax=Suillus plorans TaxID=116603 RepID=A0A9P7DS13_9AGAM|nr:nuclear protein DGCR14 [Suillus plorans]KAG1801505.1 nuclear protein DGCR14 [Suillus plorans]